MASLLISPHIALVVVLRLVLGIQKPELDDENDNDSILTRSPIIPGIRDLSQ